MIVEADHLPVTTNISGRWHAGQRLKTELSLRHGLQLMLKQVGKLAANPLVHLVATPLVFRVPFFTAEASTQDVYLQWDISKLIEDWTISFNIHRNHQLSDGVTYSQPIKINAESIPAASEIIHYRLKGLVSAQDQIYRYQLEAISRHPISQSERSIISCTSSTYDKRWFR